MLLSNGFYYFGTGFGRTGTTVGEMCFNTSMYGYQEIISDPSYAGQIIVFTFPHIGHLGCTSVDSECDTVHCRGIVTRESDPTSQSWRSESQFHDWTIKSNLIGISGVDTRALTIMIRDQGPQNCLIHHAKINQEINIDALRKVLNETPSLKGAEMAKSVTRHLSLPRCEKVLSNDLVKKSKSKLRIAVINFGIKKSLLRSFELLGVDVTLFPCDVTAETVISGGYDGVFLSNGPADPEATAKYSIDTIKTLVDYDMPMFGVCMGHQVISLALGLRTHKMPHGHHCSNHPVIDLETKKVIITSQNHTFCVSDETIPNNIIVTHRSLFDNSIEGIRVKGKMISSVQFHPESSPGPHDAVYFFENFINQIKKNKMCKEVL